MLKFTGKKCVIMTGQINVLVIICPEKLVCNNVLAKNDVYSRAFYHVGMFLSVGWPCKCVYEFAEMDRIK